MLVRSLFADGARTRPSSSPTTPIINLNDALTRVPGCRQRHGIRRRPVRDAHLGQARSTGETPDDGSRDYQRHPAAEHREPRRARSAVNRCPTARSSRTRFAPRAASRPTEEFGEIVVRADADGSIVRLKDVARIELGAQVYNLHGRLDRSRARGRSPSTNSRTRTLVKAAQGAKDSDGASQEELSAGSGLRGRARHHAAGHGGH